VGERVQASRNLQQIPNAIAKYIDIEREIDDLKQKRAEIIKTIEQLPSVEYKIIYMLYVKDFTYKEIAYDFGMSYEWVKKRRKNALRLVQDIIDKERG
jgi:RNA polymerase sigma factor (sigma-70 family)